MSSTTPEKSFEELQRQVYKKRPVLEDVMTKHGNDRLLTYAKEYLDVNLNPVIKTRQVGFLATFGKEVSRLLGTEVAERAVRQMKKYYFVSTADHHGPITHTGFVNANMIPAALCTQDPDPDLNTVISLACANVSLNNFTFPRGLLFNAYGEAGFQLHRLSFLPSNAHSATVHNFRAYMPEEIRKMKGLLHEKVARKEVGRPQEESIVELLDSIYSRPEVLDAACFSDQIAKTNFHLWRRFFDKSPLRAPNFICLEVETLVMHLLVDHHLDHRTGIHRLMFDPAYEAPALRRFDGVTGAFSLEKRWGTYLFWGVSKEKNFRVSLWKKGEELVSDDGETRISLTPEAIREAIESHQIIPSMMLLFAVLSFYYGIKCLGGCTQTTNLTLLKDAYIKMLVDVSDYRGIEACARVQTKEIVDGPVLAYLGGEGEDLTLATGIDLVTYGDSETLTKIVGMTERLCLHESLTPLMPEVYKVAYDEADRNAEVAALTPEDIANLMHLREKTTPCVTARRFTNG